MRRWLILFLLVGAAATVIGRMMWRSWRGTEVSLVAVERGRVVAAVYATGRVDTDERAVLRARVASPLEAVLVGAGEPVRRGQVLARQDPTPLRLAAERAMREAEAARAVLAEARDAAARAGKLAADGLLADDALVRAEERARELAAQLAASDAAVALAREQERWVELRAPLDGVVSTLHHRAGDALREGDDIITVVDLTRAYVRVAVDERDVGRVTPGQETRLVFDAYPDRVLIGAVWRLVPAVDRLTKSSDVLVTLPADRPALQLDLTATVNIVTGVVEDAAVVAREALEGSGGERAVIVIGEGQRAERRPVRVGSCDERRCQVLEGLREGERVVAPIPPGLRAGARVHTR